MRFNIYVPSYRRADQIRTAELLEYCTYVVRESEKEAYEAAGVNVLAAPDEEVQGIAAVHNWILENTPEEVVAIIDDDIKHFIYRSHDNTPVRDPEEITREIERLAQLAADLNLGHVTTPIEVNPKFFNCEFKFTGIVGPMKIYNKEAIGSRRVNDIPYLSADDFVLQECLYNRVILIANYFTQEVGLDTNKGGSNDEKSGKQWKVACETMQNKWGKYFVPSPMPPGKLRVKR